MMALTPQQSACLAFLRDYMAEQGMAPTVRRIAAALNLESTSGVVRLLKALEARGHIRRWPKHARAIEILHPQNICGHCGHIAGSDKCRAAAADSRRTYSFTPRPPPPDQQAA